MSLQSERLLTHMRRLRLMHLPQCYSTNRRRSLAEELPYLDFLERLLESESQSKSHLISLMYVRALLVSRAVNAGGHLCEPRRLHG
jgi:hypothetical protein